LLATFENFGAVRVFAKTLAENDSHKQQVYLGSSFDVLKLLPYREVVTCSSGKRPNFKAPISLYWLDASMQPEEARGAQLILYPDYPEVRLSGFLRGCRRAPNWLMRPIPKKLRRYGGKRDGRVFFFAVTNKGTTFAYVAESSGSVASEVLRLIDDNHLEIEGVFFSIPLAAPPTRRSELIAALRPICGEKWHEAQRRNADGSIRKPYAAQNAGGYTLESLLGITPNGRAEPDFEGWELKAYKGSRITLMTPQPDGGFYRERGLRCFVERYGRKVLTGGRGFNGVHKVGERQKRTELTLILSGFDAATSKIKQVEGGIELIDNNGALAARWSFGALLNHWGRKHSYVAFIPYKVKDKPPSAFQFQARIALGEGTDFRYFLKAMVRGVVIYDPGCSVKEAGGKGPKSRHQFRIGVKELSCLYSVFDVVEV
jgi:hypothetical protein